MSDAEKAEDAMQITAWHSKARAAGLMAFALIVGLNGSARAQTDPAANYPSKTIKIVVGFAAGGGDDILPRIVGPKLQDRPRHTAVIENKMGAGGRLPGPSLHSAQPARDTPLVGAG